MALRPTSLTLAPRLFASIVFLAACATSTFAQDPVSWPSRTFPEAGVASESDAPTNRQPPVVTALASPSDGGIFASAGDDHVVRIWRVSSGEIEHRLERHSDWVHSASFSPDGESLVTAGADGRVIFWDPHNGTFVREFVLDMPIADARFSPDGRFLAIAGFRNELILLDTQSGQELTRLECVCSDQRTVAFSPDGRWLAAAGRDGLIRIWDRLTYEIQREIHAHRGRVHKVLFSADSQSIVSAGDDRMIRIWDTATGIERQALPTASCEIRTLAFLDSQLLSGAGSNNHVHVWNLATGKTVRTLEGHTATVGCLCICEGALLSGGYDATIRVWPLSDIASASIDSRPALGVESGRIADPD